VLLEALETYSHIRNHGLCSPDQYTYTRTYSIPTLTLTYPIRGADLMNLFPLFELRLPQVAYITNVEPKKICLKMTSTRRFSARASTKNGRSVKIRHYVENLW